LHGLSLADAALNLERRLNASLQNRERVVRIIHGQGKHSENFPVIKSHVRSWLAESDFSRTHVESVFRGEDGSPYTRPNAGETVILLRGGLVKDEELAWEDEEAGEARRQVKGIRADRLRTLRRKPSRR
jgi:hypothetical protein